MIQAGVALAMANQRCMLCGGSGFKQSGRAKARHQVICGCVLRAIFRACLAKYRYVQAMGWNLSRTEWQRVEPRRRESSRGVWGRRHAEFAADVCIVARRALNVRDGQIFRMHYLTGMDWYQCCRAVGLSRGEFFHSAYRIEERLGWAFASLRPYALFPLDEYFGGSAREAAAA
jgi:hypothetical protein